MAAEEAADGVADFANAHESVVFHALAKAVEVAAGMTGLWWAADADERRQRAVGAAHGPPIPDGFAIGHLQLDFAQVHGGEVLVGDTEQEVQAVVVADLAHGAAGVPGGLATRGDDGLGERTDGGNAVPEVKAAASIGMPAAGIGDCAHERWGVPWIEDKVGITRERVGEGGKHQGSVGSERLQHRVQYRVGTAVNVPQATQGAVDHQEAAAGDAEANEVSNQRCSVERFDPRPPLRHGAHRVPAL